MATYILLLRNDAVAADLMLRSGREGAKEQERAIEFLGGKVIKQCAVMGRYDVVLMVEFEQDADCLAFSLGAARGGQSVEVLPAFEPAEVDIARERAGQAALRSSEVSPG
jgi:uncharacterized protein with GYD domain